MNPKRNIQTPLTLANVQRLAERVQAHASRSWDNPDGSRGAIMTLDGESGGNPTLSADAEAFCQCCAFGLPTCGLLIAWQTPQKNVSVQIFFSTFFPSGCSLVSRGDSVDFLSSKHVLRVLVAQGQNSLLRFSVFEASLV